MTLDNRVIIRTPKGYERDRIVGRARRGFLTAEHGKFLWDGRPMNHHVGPTLDPTRAYLPDRHGWDYALQRSEDTP